MEGGRGSNSNNSFPGSAYFNNELNAHNDVPLNQPNVVAPAPETPAQNASMDDPSTDAARRLPSNTTAEYASGRPFSSATQQQQQQAGDPAIQQAVAVQNSEQQQSVGDEEQLAEREVVFALPAWRRTMGLVLWNGRLSLEEVMVLADPALMIQVAEDQSDNEDEDEELHLDTDRMTDEEMLNLEEQTGSVLSTGLSEDTIIANLRHRIYQPSTPVPPGESEPCCICLEEYVAGEDFSKLDCGHEFHFKCIKRWLAEENSCPICKKTALALNEVA